MKRTSPSKKADAILISDLHLTDSTPVCRTDDYIEAQKQKLIFLQSLSNENNGCPVLCAGDIFDRWKASPWLCSFAFQYLPKPFICIPGQHDLPAHSLNLYHKSALSLLESIDPDIHVLKNEKIEFENLYIVGVPFGELKDFDPEILDISPGKRKILMLHELTWEKNKPHWSINAAQSAELIERFEDFDLIITGDNHSPFVKKGQFNILVNPGSVLRITAAQKEHKPRCYLYYRENNTLNPVYLPVKPGDVSSSHIKEEGEKEARIQAYIERIQGDWGVSMSFKKNLNLFFSQNKVSTKVRSIICEHLE